MSLTISYSESVYYITQIVVGIKRLEQVLIFFTLYCLKTKNIHMSLFLILYSNSEYLTTHIAGISKLLPKLKICCLDNSRKSNSEYFSWIFKVAFLKAIPHPKQIRSF